MVHFQVFQKGGVTVKGLIPTLMSSEGASQGQSEMLFQAPKLLKIIGVLFQFV